MLLYQRSDNYYLRHQITTSSYFLVQLSLMSAEYRFVHISFTSTFIGIQGSSLLIVFHQNERINWILMQIDLNIKGIGFFSQSNFSLTATKMYRSLTSGPLRGGDCDH